MDIRVEKMAPDLLKTKPDENSLGFGQHMTDHMFVMLYDEGMGWHDAVIKPYDNFSLSPAAMALHYGQAIFEGSFWARDLFSYLLEIYRNVFSNFH